MAKSCKDCYSYRMCAKGAPYKCVNYDYYTDEDVDKIHPIREVNPSSHLDLDKTARYLAQEAFGKIGWVISRPDTQQSIIAALKESLLKNCKAND